VELDTLAQDELLDEAVLRQAPRFGQARRHGVARHGLYERVVQRVEIIHGVAMPGVSAGSNQVGASEMWIPQVIWPSGAAATGPGPMAETRRTNDVAKRLRTVLTVAAPFPTREGGAGVAVVRASTRY